MPIHRRDKVGIIDFASEYEIEPESKFLCKHCLEYGFEIPLGPRIYSDNKKPADHDQWLQCHECGTIYPVHEVEKQTEIKDVVETTDSPFDSGRDFLGVDSRKTRMKKRKEHDYDYINDDELKRELKKGGILLSYSEQIPQ